MVLYGTETSNPEDIAKRIVWEGIRRRSKVSARPLDNEPFDGLVNLTDSVVLFIISTMGQGEAPLGLMSFWKKLMRKSLSNTTLSSLNCVVIGLGDSSYEKYNYAGKKLFKRLKQLGANTLLDLCLGDDQHSSGYWGSIDPFLNSLWDTLTERYTLPQFTFATDYLPPATFSITDATGEDADDTDEDLVVNGDSKVSFVSVISNERVTPEDHFQETRLIKLQSNGLKHNPGDVIAIKPENSDKHVSDLLNLMNLDANQIVKVALNERAESNPATFSYADLKGNYRVEELLRKYFDLHAVPKRCFFDLFWKFSDDEVEKGKLREFASSEGQEEVYEYCFKPKRMLIEVLRDFPKTSAKVPLNYLPDLLPAITRREFSIASSPLSFPEEIHILVVVVSFKTRLKERRTGFCSNFLAQCVAGDKITACIHSGSFILSGNKPLIMIGPGSGVAPFRGIIQHRVMSGISDNILFFGCRNKLADFYFEKEWQAFVESNCLKLFTAFSRDQIEKVYVQHRMYEAKELLLEWITKRDALILVAGSSNQMPTAVRQELVRIINESQGDGSTYVTRMESAKRLQYECWD